MGQIIVVCVIQRNSLGAAVEASGGENTVGEIVDEVGVFFEKIC